MGGYTVGVAGRSVKPLSSTRMVRLHLRPPFYKKKFEKFLKLFYNIYRKVKEKLLKWRVRQAVKSSAFHAEVEGSIPSHAIYIGV